MQIIQEENAARSLGLRNDSLNTSEPAPTTTTNSSHDRFHDLVPGQRISIELPIPAPESSAAGDGNHVANGNAAVTGSSEATRFSATVIDVEGPLAKTAAQQCVVFLVPQVQKLLPSMSSVHLCIRFTFHMTLYMGQLEGCSLLICRMPVTLSIISMVHQPDLIFHMALLPHGAPSKKAEISLSAGWSTRCLVNRELRHSCRHDAKHQVACLSIFNSDLLSTTDAHVLEWQETLATRSRDDRSSC